MRKLGGFSPLYFPPPFTQKVGAPPLTEGVVGEGGGVILHILALVFEKGPWVLPPSCYAGLTPWPLTPWPLMVSVVRKAAYKLVLYTNLAIQKQKNILFQCLVEKCHLPGQTRNTAVL